MDNTKPLPSNLSAEYCVLCAMMIDTDAVALAITELTKEDFFQKKNKIVFITIQRMFNENKVVDLLTLIDRLRKDGYIDMVDGESWINELSDFVLSTGNILNHIEIVKEKSELRKQIIAYRSGINECYEEKKEPKQIMAETFDSISISAKEDKLCSIQDAVMGTIKKIEKAKNTGEGEQTAWFGIKSIDKEVVPKAGRLIIIAGRPAHGKTTLMIQSAIQSSYHKKKSVIISMEMERDDIIIKKLSYISGVNNRKVEYPHNLTAEENKKIAYASEVIHDLEMQISTERSITPTDIRAIALRAKSAMGGLDNIYLDHLQLTSNPKYPKMIDRITENSRQLKILSGDLDCCIIALSQLNRGLEHREDKRPRLGDLRESGAIEQDADMVLGVCSFHNYKDSNDMKDGIKIKGKDFINEDLADLGTVEILKNRFGRLWVSAVKYKKQTGSFKDWDES